MTTIKINQPVPHSKKASSEYSNISDISMLDFNGEKNEEIKVNCKVNTGGQSKNKGNHLATKSITYKSKSDKIKDAKKASPINYDHFSQGKEKADKFGDIVKNSSLYQLKVDIEKAIGEKPVQRGQYKDLQEILKNNKVKQVSEVFIMNIFLSA